MRASSATAIFTVGWGRREIANAKYTFVDLDGDSDPTS